MIPSRVPNPFNEAITGDELCGLSDAWGLEPLLVVGVMKARGELPFDLWIFSGIRDAETQRDVSQVPFDVSTHADMDPEGCPRLSTGVDVQPSSIANRIDLAAVAQMGAALTRQGLRWGGGAPFDNVGIPVGVERWHVDLGARA